MPKFSIAAKFVLAVACGLFVCSASNLFADEKPCNYPPKDAADKDGWITLFNGKDLTGWKLSDSKGSKVHVEDGKIVMTGHAAHLFTDWQFKNFILEADVQTHPHANSGIYFHTHYQEHGFPSTGYESQVNVSHRDKVKTGSLYEVVKLYHTPAKDNEWYKQTIIVQGKHIIVKVNDEVVVDYTEKPEDAAKRRQKLSCGSFALQAHDPGSVTWFKNIRVKPLAD
jgi:Domain of Unknown Function (DUF1080)